MEIEQRHIGDGPIGEVFEQVASCGYNGCFLLKGQLRPVNEFSVEAFQTVNVADGGEAWINNFLFFPGNEDASAAFNSR